MPLFRAPVLSGGGGGSGSTGAAVRVTGPGVIGVPHQAVTVVAFDTEVLDASGFFDVAANTRLTVPVGLAGVYLVGWRVQFNPNGAGDRQGWLRVNGAGSEGADAAPGSTVIGPALSGHTLLDLAAGAYVELVLYQTSGGPLGLIDTGDSPALWMAKVA